jgi:hypothetical protein
VKVTRSGVDDHPKKFPKVDEKDRDWKMPFGELLCANNGDHRDDQSPMRRAERTGSLESKSSRGDLTTQNGVLEAGEGLELLTLCTKLVRRDDGNR